MISALESFHFLRPGWLLTLLPLGLILWAGWRQSATARWQAAVAPHLLEHLIERPQGRWAVKPFHLIVTVCLITAIALAGPTWRQEPSPFTEDTAPLIIALELTPYMLANDVQPSRLERAKLKALDLVRLRGGARTGLVVWAGGAHLVVPLTNDPAAIEAFVADLEPSLMPVEGREPVAALARAAELFDRDGTPGTLLFITAGLPERAIADLRSFTDQRRDQLQVLAVATTAGGQMPSGEFSSPTCGCSKSMPAQPLSYAPSSATRQRRWLVSKRAFMLPPLLACLWLLASLPVKAQTPAELIASGHVRIRATVEPSAVMVGQKANLRIQVLTRTWYLEAPAFPSTIDMADAVVLYRSRQRLALVMQRWRGTDDAEQLAWKSFVRAARTDDNAATFGALMAWLDSVSAVPAGWREALTDAPDKTRLAVELLESAAFAKGGKDVPNSAKLPSLIRPLRASLRSSRPSGLAVSGGVARPSHQSSSRGPRDVVHSWDFLVLTAAGILPVC